MQKLIKDIERMKSKLILKANSKGIYENFGQSEVRKLKDNYSGLKYGDPEESYTWRLIEQFDSWCVNYPFKLEFLCSQKILKR